MWLETLCSSPHILEHCYRIRVVFVAWNVLLKCMGRVRCLESTANVYGSCLLLGSLVFIAFLKQMASMFCSRRGMRK